MAGLCRKLCGRGLADKIMWLFSRCFVWLACVENSVEGVLQTRLCGSLAGGLCGWLACGSIENMALKNRTKLLLLFLQLCAEKNWSLCA